MRNPTDWYAFETIVLRGDQYHWSFETDVVPGPRPRSGRFSLQGNILTLRNFMPGEPRRMLMKRGGWFQMCTPTEYEEYLKKGKMGEMARVLYQDRPLSGLAE